MPIVLLLLRRVDLRRVGLPPSGGDGVSLSPLVRVRCAAAGRSLAIAAPGFAQATHLAVIVGLAGEPEHAELFERWGATLVDASTKLGVEDVIYLAEKPEVDAKRMTGKSTRDEMVKAFGKLAAAGEDDVVFIVLIGHGTFDGRVAKFNLPGPDLTPADFEPLLTKLAVESRRVREHRQRQRAVHRSVGRARPDDCDGDAHRRRALRDALRRLLCRRARGHRRRRGQESADFSARGVRITRSAKSRTAYKREGIMSTEHALLSDSGGEGIADPAADGKQGKVAAVLSLGSASATDPLPADPKAARALPREARARAADRSAETAERQHAGRALRERARKDGDRAGAQDPADSGAGKENEAGAGNRVRSGHCRRSSARGRLTPPPSSRGPPSRRGRGAVLRRGAPSPRRRSSASARQVVSRECRVRRPAGIRADSLQLWLWRRIRAGARESRRAAVGARLSDRRHPPDEDPEGADRSPTRTSTARMCSRSTIRTSSTIRSPMCRSPGYWTMSDAEATGLQHLPAEGRLHHLR